jgi:hypothetical protein
MSPWSFCGFVPSRTFYSFTILHEPPDLFETSFLLKHFTLPRFYMSPGLFEASFLPEHFTLPRFYMSPYSIVLWSQWVIIGLDFPTA